MSLVTHAESELKRAGLFDKDSDYNGMLGTAVLDLVKTFAAQGHSGMSAEITTQIFERVARFKTLSPITADPAEWMEVSSYSPPSNKPLWQNTRDSSYFSADGGKTWWNLDDIEKTWKRRLQRKWWDFKYWVKEQLPFKKKKVCSQLLAVTREEQPDSPPPPEQ